MRRAILMAALLSLAACDGGDLPKNKLMVATLEQILKTYNENPNRGNTVYQKRRFEIAAKVSAIGTDASQHPTLEFRTPAEQGAMLCVFTKPDPRFEAVKPDATVTIRGLVQGIKPGVQTVLVWDCEIVG